jgi:hypothetical protein
MPGVAQVAPAPVAQIVAALAYGERLAADRARSSVELAPDSRRRQEQQHIADREQQNRELIEARLRELGADEMVEAFRPFFEEFFSGTEPHDWLEAQTFHYVGDSLVADFAEYLIPTLDRVSGEVVRKALCERDEQDAFALEEISRGIQDDPGAAPRVAAYARRIIGEGLTQSRNALGATEALRNLLGGEDGEKRMVLDLLDRHRRRLDRLGIERVDEPVD